MTSVADGTPRRAFALPIRWIDLGTGKVLRIKGLEPSFQVMSSFVGLFGLTRTGLTELGSREIGGLSAGVVEWVAYATCLVLAQVLGGVLDRKINAPHGKSWSGRRARALTAGLGLTGQLINMVHTGSSAPAVAVILWIFVSHYLMVTLAKVMPAQSTEPVDGRGEDASTAASSNI